MNAITHQTRKESFDKTMPMVQSRHIRIMLALGAKEMTARELAYAMGFVDLNMVKPRLTELMTSGRVKVIDKRLDVKTGRNVAVYKAV